MSCDKNIIALVDNVSLLYVNKIASWGDNIYNDIGKLINILQALKKMKLNKHIVRLKDLKNGDIDASNYDKLEKKAKRK